MPQPSPDRRTLRSAAIAAAPTAREAVAYLHRHDQAELADAVRAVLDFAEAAAQSRRPSPTWEEPLQPRVSAEVAERIRQEPKGTARRVVLDACQRFLAGEWTPGKPLQVRRGAGHRRVALHIRFPSEVRDAVAARGSSPEFEAEHGYTLTPVEVAVAALTEYVSVELPAAGPGWSPSHRISLGVPAEYRDYLDRIHASGTGPHPSLVLRDAFARFLAGEWTPADPSRQRDEQGRWTSGVWAGSEKDKIRYTVGVDPQVWMEVSARGADPKTVKARGYELTASQVAIQALLDAYGVPEGLLAHGG